MQARMVPKATICRCPSVGGVANLPVPAPVQEKIDAIVSPAIELGFGHRCPETERAALWHRHQEGQELLGREFGAVDCQSAGAGFTLQQRRDSPDGFAAAAFARHDSGKLREPLGLSQHQSGERQRGRGHGCMHGQSGKTAQYFVEVAALEDWQVGGRLDPLNNPAKDRVKQRRLIWETMIKRSFGNTGALRDSLDAGGAIAFGQEEAGRDIKDAIPEQHSLRAGRATAPPRRLGGDTINA